MIILRQKCFGWWGDLNKKICIKNAEHGLAFRKEWGRYISEEEYNKHTPFYKNLQKERERTPPTVSAYIGSIAERYPKFRKELYELEKLWLDKSIMSLEPEWGDGDEYPTFSITNLSGNKFDKFTSILKYHRQCYPIGINAYKSVNWGLEDNPTKSINLKQFLLQYYQKELKNYEEARKSDKFMWDSDQYDDVITWIKALIGGVKKYL